MFRKVKEWFYNVKTGIRNLVSFREVVWNYRDYDYQHSLDLFAEGLTQLAYQMNLGYEVREDLNPKLEAIHECISIISRMNGGVYLELTEMQTGKTIYDQGVAQLADELEEADFENLMVLLKDIRTWWS